jgi:hypothetical protein
MTTAASSGDPKHENRAIEGGSKVVLSPVVHASVKGGSGER